MRDEAERVGLLGFRFTREKRGVVWTATACVIVGPIRCGKLNLPQVRGASSDTYQSLRLGRGNKFLNEAKTVRIKNDSQDVQSVVIEISRCSFSLLKGRIIRVHDKSWATG